MIQSKVRNNKEPEISSYWLIARNAESLSWEYKNFKSKQERTRENKKRLLLQHPSDAFILSESVTENKTENPITSYKTCLKC